MGKIVEPIQQMVHAPETTSAGAKFLVGIGLGGLTAITLNQWVAIVTLLYFILQIGLLIPCYIKMFRKKKDDK